MLKFYEISYQRNTEKQGFCTYVRTYIPNTSALTYFQSQEFGFWHVVSYNTKYILMQEYGAATQAGGLLKIMNTKTTMISRLSNYRSLPVWSAVSSTHFSVFQNKYLKKTRRIGKRRDLSLFKPRLSCTEEGIKVYRTRKKIVER